MIDLYAKNYFIQTWPSDVRNFVIGLINNSNNLTGSGIFYRRDVIMINADCLDTFLEKTPHAKHKISEGIAVVQVSSPIQKSLYLQNKFLLNLKCNKKE